MLSAMLASTRSATLSGTEAGVVDLQVLANDGTPAIDIWPSTGSSQLSLERPPGSSRDPFVSSDKWGLSRVRAESDEPSLGSTRAWSSLFTCTSPS